MGSLVVSTEVTIDGVMDHVEDWFRAERDPAQASRDQLRAADALLLGRKTYVGLAKVWPTMTDTHGFADRVNAIPKFVASTTLAGPLDWNATLIEGDVADRVAALKRELVGNLVVYGCGGFARYLIGHGLVDEVRFWVHPVVFGDGERPFHAGPPVHLDLVSTTMYDTGVALLTYRPA